MATDIITKSAERQYPLTARVEISGLTADSDAVQAIDIYEAINIPAGSVVVGGYIDVTTVFTATVDIDIGDDVDPDRYTSTIVEGDALGRTALTLDGYVYTTDDTIDFSIVVSATIVGAATLVVEYIQDTKERSHEIQD